MTGATPRAMHCWACRRNVLRSFSADINLCRACHLFMQRVFVQLMSSPSWWRRCQLRLALKLYFWSMRLSRSLQYDNEEMAA